MNEQRIRQAPRLCFFAHYDQDNIVADHVLLYLAALRDAGFTTVVLSTARLDDEEQAKITALGADVVLRDNHGMDFGGWIEACIRFFPITADLLLLANDSVYAPLADLAAFIDRLTAQDADFYGAMESLEVEPHLQSWFLLFRPSAYRSAAFTGLMCRPMPPIADKGELVVRYEVGLTRTLVAAGLRYRSAFSLASSTGIAARYPYNPAHILWREAIEQGVPFLKIELLRYNLVRVTNTADWRAVVAERTPGLTAMIAADLARRGRKLPPGFIEMSHAPSVYWPELRRLILADYRREAAGGPIRRHRIAVMRLAMAIARILRRLHARLSRKAANAAS